MSVDTLHKSGLWGHLCSGTQCPVTSSFLSSWTRALVSVFCERIQLCDEHPGT